ncbi:MAG: hypothetical protein EA361_09355 [Bacteroidetes bacterium]|nr:MAG: hypothetical protein EA361_09355 [Bacteroidota bacterium]
MKAPEFKNIPLQQKTYLVFEYGSEIATRQFLYFNIKLYTLFGFFAEVWYVPKNNKIEKIELLSVDEILAMYKKEFDISELLKQ